MNHSIGIFPLGGWTCGGAEQGALGDGILKIVSPFNTDVYEVALVFRPTMGLSDGQIFPSDYHWFRRDSGGYWSHKPGQTPARDFDNSRNKITDPKFRKMTADAYTSFCGYFFVKKGMKVE